MSEWLEALPTDLQGSDVLKRFDTVESLAKAQIDSAAYRGNSIRIPTEDADDAQRQATSAKIAKHFPDLMQRPEPDKGYLEQSEDFHQMFGVPGEYKPGDDIKIDAGALEVFNKMAKDAKLNKDQYASMIAAVAGNLDAVNTQNTGDATANQEALDKAWGMAAAERRGSVDALAKQFEDADDPLGPLNSAAYKMLHNIVKAFGGKFNGEDVRNITAKDSPGEAKEKLSDLHATKEWRDMKFNPGEISRERKTELLKRDIDLRRASAA